jgi:hypothetical protein
MERKRRLSASMGSCMGGLWIMAELPEMKWNWNLVANF